VIYFQGDKYRPTHPPKRIISLVPSQTELLYYLGIEPIAQTIFCIHPTPFFKKATKIGGTKKLQLDKIKAFKPDLIIGNKEENEKDQIEDLASHFPVWLSDIYTLTDSFEMIKEIGQITGKQSEALQLARTLAEGFDTLKNTVKFERCVYLIWREPYMAAGSGTFIDSVLQHLGYTNALSAQNRYPKLTQDELIALQPDVVLLSSEPYPFASKHMEELQLLLPNAKIQLVNGELFSWYGPRLLKTIAHFSSLNN
jgi:ABC-type Fe3+-hydroxamate transport system substrate-binding protein